MQRILFHFAQYQLPRECPSDMYGLHGRLRDLTQWMNGTLVQMNQSRQELEALVETLSTTILPSAERAIVSKGMSVGALVHVAKKLAVFVRLKLIYRTMYLSVDQLHKHSSVCWCLMVYATKPVALEWDVSILFGLNSPLTPRGYIPLLCDFLTQTGLRQRDTCTGSVQCTAPSLDMELVLAAANQFAIGDCFPEPDRLHSAVAIQLFDLMRQTFNILFNNLSFEEIITV